MDLDRRAEPRRAARAVAPFMRGYAPTDIPPDDCGLTGRRPASPAPGLSGA
jgi:hypothetical protein